MGRLPLAFFTKKKFFLLTPGTLDGSITKNNEEGGAPIMTHGYGMMMEMMDMAMMPMPTLSRATNSIVSL